jgi:hypothetical protein
MKTLDHIYGSESRYGGLLLPLQATRVCVSFSAVHSLFCQTFLGNTPILCWSFLCLPSVVGLQYFFVASAVLCPDCFIDWLMVTVEILDQGGSDYIGELSAVFR